VFGSSYISRSTFEHTRPSAGFFGFEMMLSRCCKENIRVLVDYYVCEKCFRACDTIFSLQWTSDSHDDSGNDGEIEKIFD
jgi:hypothetical protein